MCLLIYIIVLLCLLGDPTVDKITMTEDARIALMIKVKQGILTADQAMEEVSANENKCYTNQVY